MKDDAEVKRVHDDLNARCPAAGSRWTHLKSGGFYTVILGCVVEAALTSAVVYRSETHGTLWMRPLDEFLDGRFERVGSGSSPPVPLQFSAFLRGED